MVRRLRFHLLMVLACSLALHAKGRQWQSGDVAALQIIRTPVGKKLIYRYSYSVHANGHTYTFDEKNKLKLTVNGPVRFEVQGDRIRVVDEKGKEHQESILEKAVDKQ
jgi:hypothetical protein